jgi:GNAT superfamily N-acetyltransferase
MDHEVKARRAVPGDEDEIARLREMMAQQLFGADVDGSWAVEARARLGRWLRDPDATTAAFVVDSPDGVGLAASAIGVITERLPGPNNLSGLSGYVYGVGTDPQWRRRGFSRAAMKALLEWFEQRDVPRVELYASEYGEGLYRELGFEDANGAALTRKR